MYPAFAWCGLCFWPRWVSARTRPSRTFGFSIQCLVQVSGALFDCRNCSVTFSFILRQVSQRHTAIFAETIPEGLTTTQFATIARLYELGSCSQNRLGRLTSMDAATIKGVIARLAKRDLAQTWTDPEDSRRLLVGLTDEGRALAEQAFPKAFEITDKTL